MMDNNKTIASALKKIETIKILTKTDYSMVKAYNLLLESEESYKDDKLEGTVKKYDESGKITSEEFFKNGNRIK